MELIKFLNKNYSVALMIDQRVSKDKIKFIWNASLYYNYTSSNCKNTIVKLFLFTLKDTIKMTPSSKYRPIQFDKELNIEEITFKLNQILEKMILKNPSQWILTHDRWK